MAMIEVDHLTKRYGPVLAADDVTFTCRQGTVTGFLGPNGARSKAGENPPSAARVPLPTNEVLPTLGCLMNLVCGHHQLPISYTTDTAARGSGQEAAVRSR